MLKDGVTFMVSMFTFYPAVACPTSDVGDVITLHVNDLQQCTQEV